MREFQEASTGLAAALEPVAPSPGLRARVLSVGTNAHRMPERKPFASRFLLGAAAALVIVAIGQSLVSGVRETTVAGPVVGTVRWTDREARFALRGLPPLPPGKVYKLWHIKPGGAPFPRSTFTLADGTLRGSDAPRSRIEPGDTFAFTQESDPNVSAPTPPIYAPIALP